jgi:hypothetical protein
MMMSKGGDDEENGFSQQDMNLRFLFVPGYYLLTIVGLPSYILVFQGLFLLLWLMIC